jgi:hypothetical protein
LRERILEEFELLRKQYPRVEYVEVGHWVRIPGFPLSGTWNRIETDAVFQIPAGYPGTPPYGFYVPVGIRVNSVVPGSYSEPAGSQPPFPGVWGMFSWAPADGEWRPTANLSSGSNLSNWVRGFADRFREGA